MTLFGLFMALRFKSLPQDPDDFNAHSVSLATRLIDLRIIEVVKNPTAPYPVRELEGSGDVGIGGVFHIP